MKQQVLLNICGRQSYEGQEPDVIELMTEGTMELKDSAWEISYEETELTGMAGVTTTFRVEPGTVTLRRTGKLRSEMVFQQGIRHESLYQLDFGALLMAVTAKQVYFDIVPDGGVIDIVYSIEIENNAAGLVDYHLDIRAK